MTAPHPTVTLATGEVVDTWSPEWRAECLARHVAVIALLRMRGAGPRRQRLDDIEAQRGPVFRQRVQEDFLQAWNEERATAQPEQEKDHA